MDLTKRLKSAYDICVGSSELTQTHKDNIYYYFYCPSGVRHKGGVNLIFGFCVERGNLSF